MNYRITVLLVLLVASCLYADAPKDPVAVPEFQNSSGKIVRISRWDMAAWMSNELKRTDRFKPIDRKQVGAAIKDAEWNEERLGLSTELKLKALSARYVVYGSIAEWRLEASVVSRRVSDSRAPEQGIPGALVVFSVSMVDLATSEKVKEFLVDGNAIGPLNDEERIEPPYDETDARFVPLFEEACKQALRKAARSLSEAVSVKQ